MDNKTFKGRLKRWNKEKGFGFISSENEMGDIFIHISALKNMDRLPMVGDVIYYQVDYDKSGRKRAINAKIEGVTPVQPRTQRKSAAPHKTNRWFVKLLILVFLIAIGVFIYKKTTEETNSSEIEKPLASFTTGIQGVDNTGQNGLQVQGEGVVTKILLDNPEDSKHQRFVLTLSSGQPLLVVHNIDLALKINGLSIGDTVRFQGEYEWNLEGGVVRWTHDDPDARHIGGWLKHGGKVYR